MTNTETEGWETRVEAGAKVRAIQKFGDPWHMLLPAQQDHCKVQVAAILQAAGVKELVEAHHRMDEALTPRKPDGTRAPGIRTPSVVEINEFRAALSDNGEG